MTQVEQLDHLRFWLPGITGVVHWWDGSDTEQEHGDPTGPYNFGWSDFVQWGHYGGLPLSGDQMIGLLIAHGYFKVLIRGGFIHLCCI